MASKLFLLVLLVLHSLASSVNGECIAGQVENLMIHSDATLTWDLHPDEPCEIDGFHVDAVGDLGDEYHFTVARSNYSFSFLQICEEWQFTVTPISDGVLGFEKRLTDYIPLPPTADISIRYFNLTEVDERDVFLEWDLMNHTHGDCTLRYRITIEDTESADIQDIYVTGRSVHIHNLSPCVPYHLGVRAVNRAHPTFEGPLRFHDHEIEPKAEDPPRLYAIDIGTTTVNMTWRLENPGRNRCPIRTFYVDGGQFFNIEIPVEDTPERPPVEVDLKGLKPNSMYYLKASIENSGGKSQPAQIGVQTLELEPGSA